MSAIGFDPIVFELTRRMCENLYSRFLRFRPVECGFDYRVAPINESTANIFHIICAHFSASLARCW